MKTVYQHLFAPFSLKGVQLKNRIIMAPMNTNMASIGGFVTDRMIKYYTTRAEGGVGLITVEATAVSLDGKAWAHNLSLFDDKFIPAMTKLVQAVQGAGSKISIELNHAGRRAQTAITGKPVYAPSPFPGINGQFPNELSKEKIREIVTDFGRAAARAEAAGFDALTLHMAHGYLMNQFLSPYANKRQDEYGGSIRRRVQFATEVLQAVKESTGNRLPIICRVTVDEFLEGGITIDEGVEIARLLVAAGADMIDVTAGTTETPNMTIAPMSVPKGFLKGHARKIKDIVNVPVSVVGRISNPALAEEILREGMADLIVLGRPLVADPMWVQKAASGADENIMPCIACKQGCIGRTLKGLDIGCLVNPSAGREEYNKLKPIDKKIKIAVIGGGVAGMTAAVTAAQRGHEVALYEAADRLGGQAILASAPPYKQEIASFFSFLIHQLNIWNVKLHLNKAITNIEINQLNVDLIIAAVGAIPITPAIDGLHEEERTLTAWDVLRGESLPGHSVVIVGAGKVGCETAEYLLDNGKSVTLIEMAAAPCTDMNEIDRLLLINRLNDKGVDIIVNARLLSVKNNRATILLGDLHQQLPYDLLIFAVGSRAREFDLSDTVKETFKIGDCIRPGNMLGAVKEGYEVGNKI